MRRRTAPAVIPFGVPLVMICMMTDTSIEWTDKTWNPVAGCTVLSPGCTNCYAMRMAARLDAMGIVKYRGLTRKTGGRAKWTGSCSPRSRRAGNSFALEKATAWFS